jgi:hypothetical protein
MEFPLVDGIANCGGIDGAYGVYVLIHGARGTIPKTPHHLLHSVLLTTPNSEKQVERI